MITNYVSGNKNRINGEFMTSIYPVCPGIKKPATGEVYSHNGKIIVANMWTEQIISIYDTEEEFFADCTDKSGAPNPHNYNGWD